MTDDLERLGGRLPLFKPDALTAEQRRLHDDMTASWAPWADKAGFQAKLPDGRWIGPFNPLLLSPVLSQAGLPAPAECRGKGHQSLGARTSSGHTDGRSRLGVRL